MGSAWIQCRKCEVTTRIDSSILFFHLGLFVSFADVHCAKCGNILMKGMEEEMNGFDNAYIEGMNARRHGQDCNCGLCEIDFRNAESAWMEKNKE